MPRFVVQRFKEDVMARYKNGLNGTFSGKIGNVVAAKCRGVDYVRSLPERIVKPPTAAQLNQRKVFAVVMAWLKPLLPLINIGYKQVKTTKTAMNAAVSYHLKFAIIGAGADFRIDFKKAVFSRGDLMVSWVVEVLCAGKALLQVKWDDAVNETLFCKADDVACFIAFSPKLGQFAAFSHAAERKDKEAVLRLPAKFSGKVVHCWMQYASADGGGVSTSLYVGEFSLV